MKTIQAIWSFKRKRYPDGTLNKHKARLCAHDSMQQWGVSYSQPFLINRLLQFLGLCNTSFETNANSLSTPVTKGILHRDLADKPRKYKWKYRTAACMLSYLQNSTHLEIAMAVHQTARFSNKPMLCQKKAIMRLGHYLLDTRKRGMIYKLDRSKGLECYADADFAGGWTQADAWNAENVLSHTGYVIMYASCPILWVSRLQTEIALSTAVAEVIALLQALRNVIPLITLLKEVNTVFPVHMKTPTLVCKVHEDNQSCITMATSQKFSPWTKHIALKYHHFRLLIKDGWITISYCRTTE